MMTDWPESVREYEEYRDHALTRHNYATLSGFAKYSDAAIRDLKMACGYLEQRVERAEAECRAATALMQDFRKQMQLAREYRDEAEYAARENRDAMDNAVKAWKEAEAEARKMHTLMWRIARRYGPADKTASRVIEEEAARYEAEHDAP